MKRVVRRRSVSPDQSQSAASLPEPELFETAVASHMVAEALLAAYFIAAAERSGMDTRDINAVLRDIVAKSGIDEFWITDEQGHAYLTSSDIDFTFSPNTAQQPQASVFWPLLEGSTQLVVQEAREREIDHEVFKYVAVAGVDKPRIVQVGIGVRTPLKNQDREAVFMYELGSDPHYKKPTT